MITIVWFLLCSQRMHYKLCVITSVSRLSSWSTKIHGVVVYFYASCACDMPPQYSGIIFIDPPSAIFMASNNWGLGFWTQLDCTSSIGRIVISRNCLFLSILSDIRSKTEITEVYAAMLTFCTATSQPLLLYSCACQCWMPYCEDRLEFWHYLVLFEPNTFSWTFLFDFNLTKNIIK